MRISNYNLLSKKLPTLSDGDISELLEKAENTSGSIGGKTATLKINNIPIFIKKIPLTDIEQQTENFMSTRNMFNLPLYYQYGVGSTGFGAWRELTVHQMTTDWVLIGECAHFPLMYHYRILPATKLELTTDVMDNIDRDVKYWEGSSSIRSRLLARHHATSEIILFLEYFPENLHHWLGKELLKDRHAMESACLMIENNLTEVISFMNSQGLLHMDAHFENILTDGKQLYFTDFGLALSSKFDLSELVQEFFKEHKNYDQYSAQVNLLHSIIIGIYGKDNWIEKLKTAGAADLPLAVRAILEKYTAVGIQMDMFYRKLQNVSKLTPFLLDHLK